MMVARFRRRTLVLLFVTSQVASLVVISMVWPEWATAKPSLRYPEAAAGLLGYGLLFGALSWLFARHGDSIKDLFGPRPTTRDVRWAAAMGVGLVGLAIAGFTLLYVPLSFALPGVVEWLTDSPPLIASSGPAFHAANALTFVLLIVGAPVVEETFFRGCVLPSIAIRRGERAGVIVSSILLALLHADILGALLFAVVMARVFLETRSLWLPVVMHATNNAVVWLVAAIDFAIAGERSAMTLADFQRGWWMGAIGLFVGLPVLLVAWKRRPIGVPITSADPSRGGDLQDSRPREAPRARA